MPGNNQHGYIRPAGGYIAAVPPRRRRGGIAFAVSLLLLGMLLCAGAGAIVVGAFLSASHASSGAPAVQPSPYGPPAATGGPVRAGAR